MAKIRLDQLLVDQKHFESRTKAQSSIMAGLVFVDGQKATKAGQLIKPDVLIEIKGAEHPYVGRGGLKLEKALSEFKINVEGRVCLDIGASTGGFTDCLLQNGATLVYAIDVGYGQLDWKLRQDSRVKVFERVNARYLTPEQLYNNNRETVKPGNQADLAVIDVSFISLGKILPAVYNLLAEKAEVVALVKPQFEAGREQVERGGIVRSEKVRQEVVEKVKAEAQGLGFTVSGLIVSPIKGADGNVEFLLYLVKD